MQIFHPSTNTLSRLTIFGGAFAALGLLVLTYLVERSPYQTQVGVIREQPVPFSHEHHVRGLGIDCRYCHTSVETSSFAGMPPTYTCMSCHSQIWSDSPMLEPVRDSLQERQAARVDPGPRPARLRLLQPRHPRPEGRRLRRVPRPGRPDAADVEGPAADDGVVPRVPPPPRAAPPAQGGGLQHGLEAAEGDQLGARARSWSRTTTSRPTGSPTARCATDEPPTTTTSTTTPAPTSPPRGAGWPTARARGSGGAWRSWPDTDAFRDYVRREFPSQRRGLGRRRRAAASSSS